MSWLIQELKHRALEADDREVARKASQSQYMYESSNLHQCLLDPVRVGGDRAGGEATLAVGLRGENYDEPVVGDVVSTSAIFSLQMHIYDASPHFTRRSETHSSSRHESSYQVVAVLIRLSMDGGDVHRILHR